MKSYSGNELQVRLKRQTDLISTLLGFALGAALDRVSADGVWIILWTGDLAHLAIPAHFARLNSAK